MFNTLENRIRQFAVAPLRTKIFGSMVVRSVIYPADSIRFH